MDLLPTIKLVYPKGLYRLCNWLLAERQLARLIERGETEESLVIAAELYAKQQRALCKEGTQFILSPENFYGSKGLDHWRGPFPLPIESPKAEAEKLWPRVRAAISDSDARKLLDEKTLRVVGELGGFVNLGQTQSSRMDFVRNQFIQAWGRS